MIEAPGAWISSLHVSLGGAIFPEPPESAARPGPICFPFASIYKLIDHSLFIVFCLQYLGCIEVFESRGMQVCEEAVKALKAVSATSDFSPFLSVAQQSPGIVMHIKT